MKKPAATKNAAAPKKSNPPAAGMIRMTADIPADDYIRMRQHAIAERRSVAEILREFIHERWGRAA
jgi:hypothetical protein